MTQDSRTCPHCFNLVCTKCDCKCHTTQDWKEKPTTQDGKPPYAVDWTKVKSIDFEGDTLVSTSSLESLLKEEREKAYKEGYADCARNHINLKHE